MSSKANATECRVKRALRALYFRVDTLENYLKSIIINDVDCLAKIKQDTDKERYIQFLETTLVCTEHFAPNAPSFSSRMQLSHQNEIIFQVVERMQHKSSNRRNVLSLGFKKASGDERSLMVSSCQVEYTQPNPACTLLLSRSWKTLLSRVGDEAMLHLLESRSIFHFAPTSCYIQLTGPLIYEHPPCEPQYQCTSQRLNNDQICHSKRKLLKTKAKWYQKVKARAIKRLRSKSIVSKDNKTKRTCRMKSEFIIKKRLIMHGRNMREGLPVKHILSGMKADSDGVQHLMENIFTSSNVISEAGHTKPQLRTVLREFIKRHRRCNPMALLTTLCSTNEPDRKGRDISKTKTVLLDAPVFTRGLKRKKEKLEESEVTAPKRRKLDLHGRPSESPGHISCNTSQSTSIAVSDHLDRRINGTPETSNDNLPSVLSNNSVEPLKNSIWRKKNLMKAHQARMKMSTIDASVSVPKESVGAPVTKKHLAPSEFELPTCELLGRNLDSRQVYLWIRRVCLHVFPRQILGTKRNLKKFFKVVHRFIHAGKFGSISVSNLMCDMQVRGKHLLEDFTTYTEKSTALKCMVHWLFVKYVMCMLKGYFYLTETTAYRNRVFYYRKRDWSILQARAIKASVTSGHFKPVSKSEMNEHMENGSLGVSSLWFLPKIKDLRPIVTLGRKTMNTERNKSDFLLLTNKKSPLSVNKQLLDLFHVINYILKQNPRAIGSSALGRDDVHAALRKFLAYRLREKDQRPLYFVKLDIEGCFDTMNQKRIVDIMSKYIEKYPEYIVRYYAKMLMVQGRPRRYFCREVVPLVDFEPDVARFACELQQRSPPLHDALLVDQVRQKIEPAEELIHVLESHIRANLVTIGGKEFIQCRGISQGSVLSSLLCSFYYGHMERQHLPSPLTDELLIRQIDDFLYVTPYKERAHHFLDILLQGIPEYNCRVNEKKSLTNFPVTRHPRVQYLAANEPFPWCGLIFEPTSLNVKIDYSRYMGLEIADTMSFDISQTPGLLIREKLTRTIRLQAHTLIVDSVINSRETTVINLYQLMVLVAHKFIYCERSLPCRQRWNKNAPYFLEVILRLTSVLNQCYERRLRQVECPPTLTFEDIKWISLQGFIHALSARRNVYKRLESMVQGCQRQCHIHLGKSRIKELRSIVNSQAEVLFFLT